MLLEELAVEPIAEPTIPDLYEVVQGQMVEASPMSFYAGEVASEINNLLIVYLNTHPLGRSRVEQVFEIPLPDDDTRIMRPDLAFISYDRWPKSQPVPLEGLGFNVIPELAIEVISPSDKAEDVMAKTQEYFQGGVSSVWQIYPINRFTLAFDAPNVVRIVRESEALTGC